VQFAGTINEGQGKHDGAFQVMTLFDQRKQRSLLGKTLTGFP
jgi:hypothetical protein